MSQYIDASQLDAELAKLREGIASGNNNYVSLAAKVAANTTEINRLKGQPAPTPTPEPVPTPTPTPIPGGKVTDLGMNVSHYRYTNHISIDNTSPTGYRCSPDFKAWGEKFPVLRVMNHTAQATARNRNTSWETRIKASDVNNWDNTGLPIEALIETANACNADIWWNMPQQCDIEFMENAGDTFAYYLKPHLRVYLETPNECWQSNRGWLYHNLSVDPEGNADFGKAMELYAKDAKAKFAAFTRNIMASRVTRIVGGQEFNIGVLSSNALQWLDSNDYDAITCAGYFGNRPDNYVNGSGGFNRAFDALDAHAELARSLGKKLCIYECGQHIDVATADLTLVDSADVQDRTRRIIDKCRQVATGPVCFYSGVGRRYPNAPWPIYGTDYKPQGPTASTLGLN